MATDNRARLELRLRESGENDLLELVEGHLPQLDEKAVLALLRNPHLSKRVIELLLSERRLLSNYQIQKAIASHPKTPEPRAMNLVPALFWRDLAQVGSDSKTRPRIRRAADRRLAEKLPRLALGERIAIARIGGPGVISRLIFDKHPKVLDGLLENPRLTEGQLAPLLHSESAPPAALAQVARNRKWGLRYSIRAAIARNPSTPPEIALGILSSLSKPALREVGANVRIAPAVRQRAGLLLGVHPSRLVGKRI